jgi:catechol 2,3-dioxygenase-like lactoylglutathione lyase family enzyme
MVKNLEQSKNWYSKVLGISPWLDTSDYVEFRVGQGGLVFTAHGATTFRGPLNIESDEAICQNCDPFGNIIGLIGKVAE